MISRVSFVNSAPRLASFAPFCRLICDHLLWPDIGPPSSCQTDATDGRSRTASCYRWKSVRILPREPWIPVDAAGSRAYRGVHARAPPVHGPATRRVPIRRRLIGVRAPVATPANEGVLRYLGRGD